MKGEAYPCAPGTVLRKFPNPLSLRCPRPTLPCSPSCVRRVRTPVPPLVTPMYTSVHYIQCLAALPPASPELCWNLCSGSSSSRGPSGAGVSGAVTCWAISTELLGPRRSSFSGEGKARKVETSAGGGEDRTGAGSWGTGGTGGSGEVHVQTPCPEGRPSLGLLKAQTPEFPQVPQG